MATRNPNGLESYDPNDITIYGIDWRSWLQTGQTIESADWSISPAADAPSFTPSGVCTEGVTSIRLTGGGQAGVTYQITCQASKSNGERKTRSFFVRCAEA
jgi:hypothetical protein